MIRPGQAVLVVAGWLTGRVGYLQSVDGGHAVIRVMGDGAWPFPSIERLQLEHIEPVDLRALERAARLLATEEAPF